MFMHLRMSHWYLYLIMPHSDDTSQLIIALLWAKDGGSLIGDSLLAVIMVIGFSYFLIHSLR